MFFFEKHGLNQKEFFKATTLSNYQFPLHFHRAYEIIYIDSGQLLMTIDEDEYLVREKDLAFIFPNQLHQFTTIENSKIIVILFSPELIGDFYIEYKGLVPDNNVLRVAESFNPKLLDLSYRQKSFLYGICADLIDEKTFNPARRSSQTELLYEILLYVEQNYHTDCTLKTIAKHLKYDYTYISKLFVKKMNITFTEYLNSYRISQACYLLKNYNIPIGEIAFNCGYNNLRTFHRNFRKITNMAPKEYRELLIRAN